MAKPTTTTTPEMSELWKQCAGWLLRLEVLPENHRVVWPDATIEDVAYTLRQATDNKTNSNMYR